jgi:putative sterol carrier protein
MRLHAITGSLSAIDQVASAKAAPSAIGAEHLQDVLGQFAGAIKRIHGDAAFTNQDAGKFVHETSQFIGVLSASSDIQGGRDLDIERNADIAGTSDLHGAVQMHSTLNVDAEATLASVIVEDLTDTRVVFAGAGGALVDSQHMTYAAGVLTVSGSTFSKDVAVAQDLSVAGDLDAVNAVLSGDLDAVNADLSGNLSAVSGSFSGDLAVTGDISADDMSAQNLTLSADLSAVNAILSGDLDAVNGSFTGDVDAVDATFSGNLSAVSGTFSGDVSISGNLTVQGDQIIANTVTVQVEDKNIELGKISGGGESDATADGGGITLVGATLKTIQWELGSGVWEISHGLIVDGDFDAVSGSFSGDLDVTGDISADDMSAQNLTLSADLSAVNATLSGDLSARSGSFSADLDVNGNLTVAAIKIDGDTAQRLYIVDADGSMKDEAKLTFDGSELLVDAALEVSGAADLKSTLAVASDADLNGNLDVALASDLHGAVHMYSTLLVDQGADLKQTLIVTGAVDFVSTLDVAGAVQMDSTLSVDGQATFSEHINLDKAADQSILKTGGDLFVSSSVDVRLAAGGDIKLVDQYRAASTWSDAEGIKLASSAAEWSNFKATFGGEVSLLAALTGGGSGGKFKAEIASTGPSVLATAMADVAGGADFASKWASIVEPKIAKVDVFVNGQLMVSGSGMDYNVAANGDITFGFDLVADDIVMALVR